MLDLEGKISNWYKTNKEEYSMENFQQGIEPFGKQNCPYCENPDCYADWVDVGVGYVQCGPFYCTKCNASEIGTYDEDRALTEREEKTGWYEPGSIPGSSANVINGQIVSQSTMKAVYQNRFRGSPDWEDEELVKDWWKSIRI